MRGSYNEDKGSKWLVIARIIPLSFQKSSYLPDRKILEILRISPDLRQNVVLK